MHISKQNPLKFFLEQVDPPGGGGNPNPNPDTGTNPSPAAGDGNPAAGGSGNNPAPGKGTKSVFDVGANPEANPAGEGGGGDGNPPPVVPESYEFNIGEGLTLTDELKTRFTEIAKGAKLTQEQADSLIKMHSDIMLDFIKQNNDRIEGWVKDCQDAGYLSQENLGYCKAAIDTFGGSEAMDILVETGAINHPAVFKMAMTIGKLIAEDVPPKGEPPRTNKNSSDIMFPNSKSYD